MYKTLKDLKPHSLYKPSSLSPYSSTMIAIKANQLIFNHPNIAKYFTKYYKSTTFLFSAEVLLETSCKSTDDFVLQYSNEQKYDLQTNTIMLQLETLEKQNHEFKSSINTIADDILSKVSSQL